ncbi:MAG: phosphoribosylglycinamide formyltransferase [Ruminococcaceae bacterium]|nr:phosphoribosylglycinamide formyltransferase [Oscillospiraceae bacterium]
MNTVKVAILCSGGGTNLQAIIDAHARGEVPHAELSLVVGSKDGIYSLERAANANIPAAVVARKAYDNAADFEKALIALLDKYEIEVIVLAGFLTVLSEDFVKRYPERILNVHPSLIPSFCGDGFYGLRVHEAALAKGVKVTGATVHFVNEITDGGRIIAQKAVEVLEGDTPETLQRRVMEQAEWQLLPAALETVCNDIIEQ